MKCDDCRALISREIDGGTTPPEEAALMDHVALCRECHRCRTEQRRIHQALKELERPLCPPYLAARLAARVQSEGLGRAARWRAAGLLRPMRILRPAAAVLATVALAGAGGWFLGFGKGTVVAGPPPAVLRSEAERKAWEDWGLRRCTTPESVPEIRAAAREIAAIKERYRPRLTAASGPDWEHLNDLLTSEVLRALPEELRLQYQQEAGLSGAEVRRLLDLTRKP